MDPVRDISFYLETAQKEGAKIKGVYLTHSHTDFIAGHTEVKKALNVPIYQSHKSGAKYPIEAVDDKSSVKIGSVTLKFMDTPGHTPDGQCCAVFSQDDSKTPKLLFTGDVLFVGSVVRPDLMEGTISAAWLASALYDSWTQKLSKLPDSVMIFPAHGAGSLCGAHLSDEPKSTIGQEKASNPYFKAKGRGEFIALVLQGLPEAPQYQERNPSIRQFNRFGLLGYSPCNRFLNKAFSYPTPQFLAGQKLLVHRFGGSGSFQFYHKVTEPSPREDLDIGRQ